MDYNKNGESSPCSDNENALKFANCTHAFAPLFMQKEGGLEGGAVLSE